MVSEQTYKKQEMHHCSPCHPHSKHNEEKVSYIHIYMDESVNGIRVSREDIQEAEKLEMDMKTMMRLIDLIFLCRDDSKDIPS